MLHQHMRSTAAPAKKTTDLFLFQLKTYRLSLVIGPRVSR